nr:ATP-dependent zinc metalloprotease FTSH, chloroplastic [Tanacetum cinerariifolium]
MQPSLGSHGNSLNGTKDIPLAAITAKAFCPKWQQSSLLDSIFGSRKGIRSVAVMTEEFLCCQQGDVPIGNKKLHQLLTEMDGFSGNMGVIVTVLDTTDRHDVVLDSGLSKPGRFGRHLGDDRIDNAGRSYLENYMMGVRNLEELFLELLEGFVGLDTTSFWRVLKEVKGLQMFLLPNNKLNPQVHVS